MPLWVPVPTGSPTGWALKAQETPRTTSGPWGVACRRTPWGLISCHRQPNSFIGQVGDVRQEICPHWASSRRLWPRARRGLQDCQTSPQDQAGPRPAPQDEDFKTLEISRFGGYPPQGLRSSSILSSGLEGNV